MSFEAMKARQRLAWGLDVESYVRFTAGELGPVAERLVEIADPQWNGSVIDVGCGPGTATFPAAKRVGPGGRVLGIDLAAPMVAYAERAAQSLQLTNVAFAVGDAETLEDVADASFDCALSNFAAIFAPRPEAMVEAVARVLKPGGTFALSAWIRSGGIGAETFEILKSISGPTPDGIAGSEAWGEPGVGAARLAEAFDDVTETPIGVPCSYASVDEAWQRMRDGRPPFALAYGRLPLDQKQDVEARVREMYRKYATPDGRVAFELQALIFRGTKRA
jgi:SAM-dependent methyltransferase